MTQVSEAELDHVERWIQLDPFQEKDEWVALGIKLGLKVALNERARLLAERRAFYDAFKKASGSSSSDHSENIVGQPDATLQYPWLPIWPNLESAPFPDTMRFDWVQDLEENFPEIRSELVALLDADIPFSRAIFDGFGGKPWTAKYFYLMGKRVDATHDACPVTSALFERVPQNSLHACFSCLSPGGTLPPHVGPTNAELVCHLGLLGCDSAAIFAGTEFRRYEEGKCLILDDSYIHGAHNTGDKPRYTLMFSFWHPELNNTQVSILKTFFSSMYAHIDAR